MDPVKAKTLQMMQEIVKNLDYITAGDELSEQVVDYLNDNNIPKAYEILKSIDSRYWHGPAQKRVTEKEGFAEVMIKIIENFGVYLDVFKPTTVLA